MINDKHYTDKELAYFQAIHDEYWEKNKKKILKTHTTRMLEKTSN